MLQPYTPGLAGLSTLAEILINAQNKVPYVTEGHILSVTFVSYGKLVALRVGRVVIAFSSTIRVTSAKGLFFLGLLYLLTQLKVFCLGDYGRLFFLKYTDSQ